MRRACIIVYLLLAACVTSPEKRTAQQHQQCADMGFTGQAQAQCVLQLELARQSRL
jgi:hypothetical protein